MRRCAHTTRNCRLAFVSRLTNGQSALSSSPGGRISATQSVVHLGVLACYYLDRSPNSAFLQSARWGNAVHVKWLWLACTFLGTGTDAKDDNKSKADCPSQARSPYRPCLSVRQAVGARQRPFGLMAPMLQVTFLVPLF